MSKDKVITVGGRTFELAPQDAVEELQPWVDKILEAVGHPEALVTDESRMGGFVTRLGDWKPLWQDLKAKVGHPFEAETLVVDLARAIRNAEAYRLTEELHEALTIVYLAADGQPEGLSDEENKKIRELGGRAQRFLMGKEA